MANATNYTIQYRNASNLQNFFATAPNTLSLPSNNLNWTNWTDTISTLTFNRSKTDFNYIGLTVDDLFRPEVFSYPVVCSYPISGQYGFLARLSYYVLLIFSLILRKHVWLSTAALGTAMAYGATTCVHAFALLVRYKYKTPDFNHLAASLAAHPARYFGDLDMVPMLPILASGCVMLTPILNWSQNIKRQDAQSVVVWWGLLMFSALIPVAIKNWQTIFPSLVITQLATCEIGGAGCNTTSLNETDIISKDFYNLCKCNDTCGATSIAHSPFRKNANLQAFTITNQVFNLLESKTLSWFYAMNLLILIFVGGQGILGLIEVKFTQAEVRNWMFRLLAGPVPRSERQTFGSKLSYHFAKWVAAGFFMAAIVVATICPLVFASSIIVNEIVTWGYPMGENYDAIGQWSIWVSALFVIIAAIIQKYNHAWLESIQLGFETLRRLMKWTRGKATLRAEATKQERNKHNSAIERTREFFRQLARPFVHVAKSIANSWSRVELEWDDFLHWCKDPVHASSLPPYHWRVYLPHTEKQGRRWRSKKVHRVKDVVETHYESIAKDEYSTDSLQQFKPAPLPKDTVPPSPTQPAIVNESARRPDPLVPPLSRYSISRPKKVERRATEPVQHVAAALPRRATERSSQIPSP